ncbi:class I SAM-dependent methyltransferase [Mycolicibacterium mageritense]|nr:class I SAM-dependent methyltransferase [Mycolicibacterium mageritense]
MLDRLVDQFIADHPDAVVVELGCGLETRMHRLAPPVTVDWYDIDLPDVIALRRQLIPELDRGHPIAASLTEPGWLTEIPCEQPAIIVADGVLGFLTEADNKQILRTITDHFTAGGELIFNAYTPLVARMMGALRVLRDVGIPKNYRGYGIANPHAIEELNPNLTFIEEQLGAQAPEADQFPWATRLIAKIFARWRAQARRGVWIVLYHF